MEFAVALVVVAVGLPLLRREPGVALARLALISAGVVTAALVWH